MMKKLLSLLTIGFILCSPLLLKSGEFWIQTKDISATVTQAELALLMEDSDVIAHQVSGRFQTRGAQNTPIMLLNIPGEAFKLYLDALKFSKKYETINMPNQALNFEQIKNLLITTDFLQSKTGMLYVFMANEFLGLLRNPPVPNLDPNYDPNKTLNDWLSAGGIAYLAPEKLFAKALNILLQPQDIIAEFKTGFSVNDRPESKGRKIIEATFLPTESKLAIALSDGTLKIYAIQPQNNDHVIIFGYNSFFPQEFLKSKGEDTFSHESIAFNPKNSALFYYNTSNSLTVTDLSTGEQNTIDVKKIVEKDIAEQDMRAYKNTIFLKDYKPMNDGKISILTDLDTLFTSNATLTSLIQERTTSRQIGDFCKYFPNFNTTLCSYYNTGFLTVSLLQKGIRHDFGTGLRTMSKDKTLSPNGKLAAATYEHDVDWKTYYLLVWDVGNVEEGTTKQPYMETSGYFSTITFSPDSKYLFGVGENGLLQIWNTETKTHRVVSWRKKLPFIQINADGKGPQNPSTFTALYFSANGKYIIEVIDEYVFVWEISSDLIGRIRNFINGRALQDLRMNFEKR
jgi:WD40 repeat protein